jgi:cytochrome P450
VNRHVESDIELSDGTILPKNALCIVLAEFSNSEIYPEPDKFDAWRFIKAQATPSQGNAWSMVSVSPDQMSFGIGKHACPGRFFAVNEVKIVLCHMLLKYDWQFVPGKGRPISSSFELEDSINTTGEIQYKEERRRSI